jgi:hypothetical protein
VWDDLHSIGLGGRGVLLDIGCPGLFAHSFMVSEVLLTGMTI